MCLQTSTVFQCGQSASWSSSWVVWLHPCQSRFSHQIQYKGTCTVYAARAKSDRRGRDRTHGPHAGEPEDSESAHVYCLVVDWLLTEASFQTKSERVLFRISPPRRHGRAT